MSSTGLKAGVIGRGRGKWKPLYGTRPRRPEYELIEKGLQTDKKIEGLLKEEPQDEQQACRDISSRLGKISLANSREGFSVNSTVQESRNGTTREEETNEIRFASGGEKPPSSSLKILMGAVNKPEFVPRSLQLNMTTSNVSNYSAETMAALAMNYEQEDNELGVWDEYVPAQELYTGQICINPEFFQGGGEIDNDQESLDVFQNLIDEIVLSPFDEDLYHFGVNLLCEWVQRQETLEAMAMTIMEQGIEDPSFRYPGSRLAQALSEVREDETVCRGQFKLVFLSVAQSLYKTALLRVRHEDSPDNMEYLCNLAMFFGELLNSMKFQNRLSIVWKKVAHELVSLFLKHPSQEVIQCLVKFLKLTGPAMDEDKEETKDNSVDVMFDEVRDFVTENKSNQLTSKLKDQLLKVYDLHKRSWDRNVVPKGITADKATVAGGVTDSDNLGAFSADEFTTGDFSEPRFTEIYGTEEEMDEIDDAYEEFLRMSGQV